MVALEVEDLHLVEVVVQLLVDLELVKQARTGLRLALFRTLGQFVGRLDHERGQRDGMDVRHAVLDEMLDHLGLVFGDAGHLGVGFRLQGVPRFIERDQADDAGRNNPDGEKRHDQPGANLDPVQTHERLLRDA